MSIWTEIIFEQSDEIQCIADSQKITSSNETVVGNFVDVNAL